MGAETGKHTFVYQAVGPAGDEICHIRFQGNFKGLDMIWDAEIGTLAYYLKCVKQTDNAGHPMRQFIEVGDPTTYGRFVRIGLNVPRINEQTIKKTIIMLRQYKLLTYGRHEYGGNI